MMNLAKESPKKLDHWLRSFYQNSINCDGTLVFLDGPANYDLNTLKIGIFEKSGYATKNSPIFFINEEDQKNKIAQNTHFIGALSPAEVFALYKLVDTTKKTEDIDIDSRIDSLLEDQSLINSQLPKPKTHYNLEYSRIKSIEDDPTHVCPFTLGPYKDSTKNAITLFGSKNKQIFAYKYFSNFVKQFKKFPTTHELLIYMAEKQSQKEDSKNTLPATDINFSELITNIISKFKEAMTQLLLNKDKLQNILNASPLVEQSKKDEFKLIFNEFNYLAKQSKMKPLEEKEIAHQPEKIKVSKEANSPSNRSEFEINIDKIIELLEKNKIVLQPEDIKLIRNNKIVACQKFGKFEIEILDGIMNLLKQKKATLQPKDIQTLLAIIKTKPCGYQKCDKYKIEILENALELLEQNEVALQPEDIQLSKLS